jgi:hypothetical protein
MSDKNILIVSHDFFCHRPCQPITIYVTTTHLKAEMVNDKRQVKGLQRGFRKLQIGLLVLL